MDLNTVDELISDIRQGRMVVVEVLHRCGPPVPYADSS